MGQLADVVRAHVDELVPRHYYTYNAGAAGSFRAAAAGAPILWSLARGLSGAWTAAGRCYFDLSDYTTLVSKQDKLGACRVSRKT